MHRRSMLEAMAAGAMAGGTATSACRKTNGRAQKSSKTLTVTSSVGSKGGPKVEVPPPSSPTAFRVLDWDFHSQKDVGVCSRATVLVPKSPPPKEGFPVLVALHGRGEAVRGAEVGAYGWLREYALGQTIAALATPLTAQSLGGISAPARLAQLNASLAKHPYGGMVIVCPHCPDILKRPRSLSDAKPFGDWVRSRLLARVKAQVSQSRQIAIDGVSLGGRMSLLVGLMHPHRFQSVGAMQPAIYPSELHEIVRQIRAARKAYPRQSLRLLTSSKDYFRPTVLSLHRKLKQAKIRHQCVLIPGPHDYAFNKGPGGFEMVLHHERLFRHGAGLGSFPARLR